MRKLIFDPLKTAAGNLELVLILFISGVLIKYFSYGITGGKDPAESLPLLSIAVNIFLMTATTRALLRLRKKGKWKVKDYLQGGIKSFPFVFIWIIVVFLLSNGVYFFLKFMHINLSEIFLIAGFLTAAYITSAVPVNYIAGKSAAKSIKHAVEIIQKKTGSFILGGTYILFILAVTSAVLYSLWSSAVTVEKKIMAQVLVLTGELIRNFSVVVIMSTIVNIVQEKQ